MKVNVETQGSIEESSKPSLLKIVLDPTKEFQKIRNKPSIFIPLLIISLCSALIGGATTFFMDTETLLKDAPTESAGILEGNAGLVKGFLVGGASLSSLITPFFTILLLSVFLLLLVKIKKSDVTFKQLFSMNTYIYTISIIGTFINSSIILLIHGDLSKFPTSLGAMVDSEGVLSGILSKVEIFQIWQLILIAIGLQYIAKISKAYSYTIVTIIFILSIAITVSGKLIS